MDSLVIVGNKDKIEALKIVNELYDTYDGRPEVTDFVIRVFYTEGKIRSVNISFSGEQELSRVGGELNA